MRTKAYAHTDLEDILRQMIDYLEDQQDEERESYLKDLAYCGLFHDAIGEIEKIEDGSITVLLEY